MRRGRSATSRLAVRRCTTSSCASPGRTPRRGGQDPCVRCSSSPCASTSPPCAPRPFVISLVIMPVLMGGSIFVQWLLKRLSRHQDEAFRRRRSHAGRTPLSVDREDSAGLQRNDEGSSHAQGRFSRASRWSKCRPRRTPRSDRRTAPELSERVRKGDLFGFLEIGREILEPSEGQTDKQKARHSLSVQPPHEPRLSATDRGTASRRRPGCSHGRDAPPAAA